MFTSLTVSVKIIMSKWLQGNTAKGLKSTFQKVLMSFLKWVIKIKKSVRVVNTSKRSAIAEKLDNKFDCASNHKLKRF